MKTIVCAAVLAALPLMASAQEPATSAAAASSAGTSQGVTSQGASAGASGHHDWFAQADANGDGQISREEAQAAGAAVALKRFDKLDLNKDGVVTRAEVQQAHANRRATLEQKFEARFKAADTNGAGGLSKTEMAQAFPRLARHFEQLDANRDGLVTLDEIKAARQRWRSGSDQTPG